MRKWLIFVFVLLLVSDVLAAKMESVSEIVTQNDLSTAKSRSERRKERDLLQKQAQLEEAAQIKEMANNLPRKSYRAARRQKAREQRAQKEAAQKEAEKRPLPAVSNQIKNTQATAMPSLYERMTAKEKKKFDDRPVDVHRINTPLEGYTRQPDVVVAPKLEAIPAPPGDLIEFQFQDADLSNFVTQIEAMFDYSFITDDAIDPLKGKSLKQNKITFKTVHPITKKEAWALFTTFLDAAGFNIVPQADPSIFRIQPTDTALRAPLPTYIDVDFNTLPENDTLIRYLYFVKNSSVDSIRPIIESLRSTGSGIPIYLQENKGVLLTDKSYNIRALMKVVSEFDKACTPQSWAFVPLHFVDAERVTKLYESLAPGADNRSTNPLLAPRRQPTTTFFSENTRVIAEPRSNAVILLGPPDGIKKLEKFITKHLDVEIHRPYSPLNVYHLKYADATTIAAVMTEITAFNKDSSAAQTGGLRGEDRYHKPLTFVPETATNSVIVKGDYEGYLTARAIIEQLDSPQPQIAIEILILSVTTIDSKTLGIQLRSKSGQENCGPGGGIKFQTSGLNIAPVGGAQPIQQNPNGVGVQRLLGNLLNLVTGATPGNTVVTLGSDMFGVWGIFDALQTVSDLEVISNPFVTTTNRKTAVVSVGETRRVTTTQIIQNNTTTSDAQGDLPANLTVTILPQINADGMTVLDIRVDFNEFSTAASAPDLTNGNTTTRKIATHATVADQEVLALGGIIRNTGIASKSKFPILGDIPLLGWFFKNEQKEETHENLLILVSTKILEPEAFDDVDEFSNQYIAEYQRYLQDMGSLHNTRDPIERTFFGTDGSITAHSERFIFDRRKKYENKRNEAQAHASPPKEELVDAAPPQKRVVADAKNDTASTNTHAITKRVSQISRTSKFSLADALPSPRQLKAKA
jgi:general secretion pathway protein D